MAYCRRRSAGARFPCGIYFPGTDYTDFTVLMHGLFMTRIILKHIIREIRVIRAWNSFYKTDFRPLFDYKKMEELTLTTPTLLFSAVSLILLLFISACASYPLARFKFKLAQPIYGLIVACMSIPVHITLIPVFKMSKATGLYDSIWALIGPYIAFAVPISVFILTSFMQEIPREIEESAEIDGCGKIQMFFSMILPLAKPGLATLAIYNGVNMWNEFSFAYTLTQSSPNRTLPLAIWEFQGQYSMNTPMIMAVLTLTLLPMIIMFIIFQDKLVKGMTAGAVKE